MCRWFVYISPTEPCLLEDVLINPDNALAKQIHDHYLPGLLPHNPTQLPKNPKDLLRLRNSLYNLDGLGVVWYTPTRESFVTSVHGVRPAMYKTISPPGTDFNFKNLCANVETTTLFGHLRAGTGGGVVSQPNCHPFVFGRHTFMHNGDVNDYRDVSRYLYDLMHPEAFKHLQGTTESEILAALYITHLTGSDGSKEAWEREYPVEKMRDALRLAILDVIGTQRRVMGGKMRPSSLNLAVTDGRRLVASRFRNHKVEQPPSLYFSTTAGVSLNRKFKGGSGQQVGLLDESEHGTHLIVSSEPSTYEEHHWTLIDRNSCLVLDVDGSFTIQKVPYDQNLNGKEPEEQGY